MRIGKVYFNKWNAYRCQPIAQCHASVCKGRRIDNDVIHALMARILYSFEQFVFGITLHAQQVVAVIEGPADGRHDASISALAAQQLAPYKRPKQIVVTNELPRNAMGKVVKAQVRDLLG